MDKSIERSVYIRGKAVDCALGNSVDAATTAMLNGQVRTESIPFSITDPDQRRPYYLMSHTDIEADHDVEARFYQPLYDTVARAIEDAGLLPADLRESGIFLGSTSMDIPIYEARYNRSEPKDYFTQSASGFGTIADNVARHFAIDGPCHTFTTACTSSANGLLYAASLIRMGEMERALVIGYDRFNKLGFYGFESLKLLSATSYRPFDKNRGGIIMGEACGVVVLDSHSQDPEGFRILGGANACDTHNVALHNTDGNAVARVMAAAMAAAGISTRDIVAIKAHATGSHHNDLTEACAIRTLFGDSSPPVTGLKPYVGHTVGASGVTEMVLFTESIDRGVIPATPGFQTPDEELAIIPVTQNRPAIPGSYMLNYFGFGGNCTTIVVDNTKG
jgi:3-oxoacyl-[acyl-carrier-protein] synthase I